MSFLRTAPEHLVPTDRSAPRHGLLVVLAVALVARILYWVLVTPDYSPDSDAAQYFDLARNIVNGRGYAMTFPQLELHPTAFRPPSKRPR